MNLRGEAAEYTVAHGKWWVPLSKKPACLSILPSFEFWAVQIIPFNGLTSGGSVREPWLHWPLPCRQRLCFDNLRSSYETMALKVWVLKSVDNILGSTWVCGRLRPYPAWSWGRKPCWQCDIESRSVRRRSSPLVWEVHGLVKVFLPGQVLPSWCFSRKVWFLLFLGVISH